MDSFNSVVVGPKLSNLKNLSKLCLYCSPLREIQLDGLELLRDLSVERCKFLEGLSVISSSMRKLCKMVVWDCPKLLEIRFRSVMESLKVLKVDSCVSLGGLYGLSNSKKLTNLEIQMCNGLRVVEGLEELELLSFLSVKWCESLERLIDVSNSKIPNECTIRVWVCGKFPDTYRDDIRYRDYREMILGRTGKTFNEEYEMEENGSIHCFICILECIC
ncbi:disease resistance protein L6-like isoform X2 [Rhodamnia argentea]|uniref:Disease resistance protein L6-like isoform X2 n=1 Tax=Rhodamnia argentea TaxID=178133 RepID=A0ABM3H8V7_9MYRT|nr:disease resistance protein L6-like isoform X2 [Rhodamnia argentea]